MKYKIGDKVKVRGDLEVDEIYGSVEYFIDEMEKYKGTIVKIKDFIDGSYLIEEDNGAFVWADKMFEDSECKRFNAKGELSLMGIILNANYEYQKIVKINPTALHYENDGIKYVCPVCQSLGVRLQLTKDMTNCPTCNVNLNWEE